MDLKPSAEREQPEFRTSICSTCGKPSHARKGSITSWLFSASVCKCKKPTGGGGDVQFDSTRSGAYKTLSVKLSNTRDRARAAAAAEASLPALSDKVKQNYEIVSRLGEGGMGQVYLIKERITGKLFALKLIRQELMSDPRTIKQFDREATAVSKLIHPNLVGIVDHAAPLNGAPYLIMEYVEGTSLAALLQKYQRLDPSEVLQIFLQVCSAIEHAHGRGVLHCDIKPSNIIINEDSDNYVKVIDFGIAKLIKGQQLLSQDSHAGELVGTPEYMSPEHCQSEPLDARSDIYSIGCVMYEALSGKPPFTNRNTIKLILDQVNTTPAPLNKSFPELGIPGSLSSVVHKCLKKRPEERYQKAAELNESLKRLAAGDPVKHAVAVSTVVKLIIGVVTIIICACIWYFFVNPRTPAAPGALAPFAPAPVVVLPVAPASLNPSQPPVGAAAPGAQPVAAPVKAFGGAVGEMTVPVDLKKLCADKSLTTLDLSFQRVKSDEDLSPIASLKNLRTLRLTGADINDKIFTYVVNLPDLNDIAIGSTDITANGTQQLVKMPQMKSLSLAGSNIVSASMDAISQLHNLVHLNLNYSDFSDGDVSKLKPLRKLRTLLIACYGITDAGISQMRGLPLTRLDISRSGVTDQGINDLARMSTLKNLDLSRTSVGDSGIAALEHSKLEALDLVQTQVTEVSAVSLNKMKTLRELFIDTMLAHTPAFDKLAKDRPECFINKSNPAIHSDGSPKHEQVQPASDAALQAVPVQVNRLKQ